MCILNSSSLAFTSGGHIYIFLSSLHDLKIAESKWSGLFVAAITIRFGASSKALYSWRNCETSSALFASILFVLFDSSESISSKNKITGHESLAFLAFVKNSFMFLLFYDDILIQILKRIF